MKLTQRHTARLAAALALAAASSLALAQHGNRSDSPYYRNHQSAQGVTSGSSYGNDSSNGSSNGYGLREDLDGTVVSDQDATQACDVLSSTRKRESCVARVSGEVLRDEGSAAMPMDQDGSANGRTRSGSDYNRPAPTR